MYIQTQFKILITYTVISYILQITFCNNGYSLKEIPHAVHPPEQFTPSWNPHMTAASMPSESFNSICRVLLRQFQNGWPAMQENLQAAMSCHRKSARHIQPPLSVSQSVHWTNWLIHHHQGQGTPPLNPNTPNEETDYGWTEHNTDLRHPTMLKNTSILARKSWCMDWLRMEAAEIEMHTRRSDSPCRLWKPVIHSLKGKRQLVFSNNVMVAPPQKRREGGSGDSSKCCSCWMWTNNKQRSDTFYHLHIFNIFHW